MVDDDLLAASVPPPSPRAKRSLSRALSWAALAGWSGLVLVAGAYLLAAHEAPLPQPGSAALAADVAQQRRPEERGQWLALHALFAECGCSQRVAEHLLARHPMPGMRERVLFVGESPRADELAAAGYEVEKLDEDTLRDRYGFEGVPAFALVAPDGGVRYVGGYTRTKQGSDFVDVSATAAALRGESTHPLPIFGCAVSRALQQRRDPLGLL